MNLQNLTLTLADVAGSERLYLADILPLYEYKEGQRTEKQIGLRYFVVAPDSKPKYLAFSAKITKMKPLVSSEELEASTEPILISFTNFYGKMYRGRDGEYKLSAVADDAELLLE